ncbi:UNVERIFIED_CONTAM: hypothetical protein Sradi_6862700 [Sesamum radiatum]|uniref:Uncharacterized protein n=1 Tax=Sesamum radiatum TaxID=300843 RepID=A0AAW2JKA1_SESRA
MTNNYKDEGYKSGVQLHIKQRFTSVSHPQANGQIEVTNRILVQGIKKRLDKAGGNWVEELTSVLCPSSIHRTRGVCQSLSFK